MEKVIAVHVNLSLTVKKYFRHYKFTMTNISGVVLSEKLP